MVLNKTDLIPEPERSHAMKRFLTHFKWKNQSFIISALTGNGCRELMFAIAEHLEAASSAAADAESAEKIKRKRTQKARESVREKRL